MSTSTQIVGTALRLFDENYYRARYGDKIAQGCSALDHYIEEGWRRGYNPSRRFDTLWYLVAYSDVRLIGICPLVHYITWGAAEGRHPAPRPDDSSSMHAALIAAFDEAYYLTVYPDVAAAGVVPLLHYLDEGWREGRNPNSDFDTRYYLDTNPEVAASGECPFGHYVMHGMAEGRPGKRRVSPQRIVINGAADPREQSRHWIRPMPTRLETADALLSTLDRSVEGGGRGLVLSLSHDDYVEVVGGVQNCVGDEQRIFNAAGWSYLHLCPAQPLPLLSDQLRPDQFYVQMRLNGEKIGTALLSEVTTAVRTHRDRHPALHLVVHHLYGFSPEAIVGAAQALRPNSTVAWIHDYFTLCVNPPLMRNNVEFCGAPPPDSQTCGVCCFGRERRNQTRRIAAFFKALQPIILSPSATALDFWRGKIGFNPPDAKVVPHGRIRKVADLPARPNRPIRVGFAGMAAYHKGWSTFEELVRRHRDDDRYAFVHLGMHRAPMSRKVDFVQVSVSSGRRDAMMRAIREAEIDIIVQWSLCYETFSFTSYEALAGGAFVIARKDAGNVWPAVSATAPDQGLALEDEAALYALFAGNALPALLAKRSVYEFTLGGITADYLLEARP